MAMNGNTKIIEFLLIDESFDDLTDDSDNIYSTGFDDVLVETS
jgi:hypothetical protein